MSNGLTDIFIATIGQSGSHLAGTDDEKNFIIWLLTRDQDFLGHGTVGFNLCEMPWSLSNCHQGRTFLLNVAAGVKKRIGWDHLPYDPNEDLLFPCIDSLSSMLETFGIDDVDERYRLEWIKAGNPSYRIGHGEWAAQSGFCDWVDDGSGQEIAGYAKCPVHELYLTCFGCLLCKHHPS